MVELMLGEAVADELAASLGASDQGNLEYFALSAAEVAACEPLLAEFEQAFGFDSRGGTVEQLIDTRGASIALEIAVAFQARSGIAEVARSAAETVEQALEAALAYGSFVEFALSP